MVLLSLFEGIAHDLDWDYCKLAEADDELQSNLGYCIEVSKLRFSVEFVANIKQLLEAHWLAV